MHQHSWHIVSDSLAEIWSPLTFFHSSLLIHFHFSLLCPRHSLSWKFPLLIPCQSYFSCPQLLCMICRTLSIFTHILFYIRMCASQWHYQLWEKMNFFFFFLNNYLRAPGISCTWKQRVGDRGEGEANWKFGDGGRGKPKYKLTPSQVAWLFSRSTLGDYLYNVDGNPDFYFIWIELNNYKIIMS